MWATVAAIPIGTMPKTMKLFQNARFAVPSSVWTLDAALPSSSDYKYVTPSTVSDSNTGETGSSQRNVAQTSDFRL